MDITQYRIVFIFGVRTHAYHTMGWRKTLKNYDKVFIDAPRYFWWEHEKLESVKQKTLEALSVEKPTFIIAHSFGGVIAQSALNSLDKSDHIKGLITLASPHGTKRFGVNKAKEVLNYNESNIVPTRTFGGYLDPIVLFNESDLKNAAHQNFWCEHLSFLMVPGMRRRILREAQALLNESRT